MKNNFIDVSPPKPKAILAGVSLGLLDDTIDTTSDSMRELKALAETAGYEIIGEIVQNKHKKERATYFGSGKIEEIKELAKNAEAVIIDDEIMGSQERNLTNLIGKNIVDRTKLILNIFKMRAESKEGQLQVRLAELKYKMTRLAGEYYTGEMVKTSVGGGKRGVQESQLELDKRKLRYQIGIIQKELDEVRKIRHTKRKSRDKSDILQIALVGYTNSGKSTLLNTISGASVLAKDMLFATLDPFSIKFSLPSGREAVLCDTVGFIRKLPHSLIAAFSSTLEESLNCDILLHVIDSASHEYELHERIVDSLLEKLGASDKPILKVYNKTDISGLDDGISAKNNVGIEELLEQVEKIAYQNFIEIDLLIPYDKGHLLKQVFDIATVESETYEESGTKLHIKIEKQRVSQFEEYIV